MKRKFLVIVGLLIGITAMLIILTMPKQSHFATDALAKHFYSFYYESISRDKTPEDVANILESYVETGITTSFEDAMKLLNEDDRLKVVEVKNCDLKASTITFFPKVPYDKDNYKYETKLVCP